MSYNIRYDNPADSANNWENRKSDLANQVLKNKPDILGTQEGLSHQLAYLNDELLKYNMIGVGREDGINLGEFTAIFYDSSKYKLIKTKTFWLSKTPELVSIGWDAAMERICTYGHFLDHNSQKELHVFNTHFDHMGNKARIKSAKLISTYIKKLSDSSCVILMGDLNSIPESKPIRIFNRELYDGSNIEELNPIGTFNGFNENMNIDSRIDYIFVKNLNVINYQHLNDRRVDGGFISDHLPVLVKVQY